MESVKLSELSFKSFGLDINKNILNPPKCEEHDLYGLMKWASTKELQDGLCNLVCKSGKYPCGVVVLKRDNTVVIGYSDKEKPTEICRYKNYGFKDAPKAQRYLAIGELVTKTYELDHYGIMVELEDNFYQTIMG